MTKREAKAVEILQSFDKPCGAANMEMILRAMDWIAEECVLASGGLKGDQQMIAIRNAGMEDV